MLLMSDQEPYHGFQDIRDWQATFFRQNANTTTLIQSNAGHGSMLHRSAPQTVAGIVAWLASKGLAPADPRHDEDRDDQGDDHDDGVSSPDFDLN
jgi:hypothetical protein